MTKTMMAAALLGALAMTAPAGAQEITGKAAGTLLVRGRLIDVMPWSSPSSTSVGGHVDVSNSVTPEVDFSYFLTDNIAFELIAATSKHQLTAKNTAVGGVNVGSTWVLPPALTAQYHFNPKGTVSPYLGAGLNYTFFYNAKPGPGLTKLALSNNVGGVLQAGVDVAVGPRTFLNVDVKQIFLHTDAKINGGAIRAKTDLNPLVMGAGLGYRF